MKKYILTISLLTGLLFNTKGQTDVGFSSVSVVNGKVVFEQFIVTDAGLTASQRYAQLQKWVKEKYNGSPLLSGIRFDDKSYFITVSAKANLVLPPNSAGVREEVIMNYRFDTSITGAGCMLVVRDITFQNRKKDGSSFPKVYTAEETITDQAVNRGGEERELRENERKATIAFMNDLYSELTLIF